MVENGADLFIENRPQEGLERHDQSHRAQDPHASTVEDVESLEATIKELGAHARKDKQ